MVWAHNVHVMNAGFAPGFHDVHSVPRSGDMKTTGVFVKQWLGPQVYTLGITAYAGQEGFAIGGPVSPIPPAPDGSFEAVLHTLGYSQAFVDFRKAEADRLNPIHGPTTIRIPKFESQTIVNAGRIYDGIFFIDQMTAATHI